MRRVRSVAGVRTVLLHVVTATELGVAVGLILAVLGTLGEMLVKSAAEVSALALRVEATQGGLGGVSCAFGGERQQLMSLLITHLGRLTS